jgi:hypothetical protein
MCVACLIQYLRILVPLRPTPPTPSPQPPPGPDVGLHELENLLSLGKSVEHMYKVSTRLSCTGVSQYASTAGHV